MSKKGVEDMIQEIEIFLDNCKYTTFGSDKIKVPKQELQTMLNELRLKFPSELERSKKIMRNKEGIMTTARTKAEAIIAEATREQERLVSQSEIVTLANIQAEEIIRQAQLERNEILNQANAEANEIRVGVMDYSTQMLDDIEQYVAKIMDAERANYENLMDSLQNNAETLAANRREMEDQKIAMLRSQQPEVAPEANYVDSAFAGDQQPAYEDGFSVEEIPEAYEETPAYNEAEVGSEGEQDAEAFEYEEEDDIFGE